MWICLKKINYAIVSSYEKVWKKGYFELPDQGLYLIENLFRSGAYKRLTCEFPRGRGCDYVTPPPPTRGSAKVRVSSDVSQQTINIDPLLCQCWASVCDAGPALTQYWVEVLYLWSIVRPTQRGEAPTTYPLLNQRATLLIHDVTHTDYPDPCWRGCHRKINHQR